MAVEQAADEGRVAVGVEKIQRPQAHDTLVVVGEVDRHVERALRAFRHERIGGHAAEANADVAVLPPVDGEHRRDVHIGVVEVRQLLFPVGILELQEQGTKGIRVVERLVSISSNCIG